MKITILGSEGYVGTTLQKALAGHELQRIDIGVWRSPGEGVVHHRSPIDLLHKVKRFEPDHIVCLAAIAHDPLSLVSQKVIYRNTCDEVLELSAGTAGTPKTVISSLAVHSDAGNYPAAKRVLERGLLYQPPFFADVSIIRFGTLFGPCGDAQAMRSHLLLNNMVFESLTYGVIPVSAPALRRPVQHIDTAVDAIVRSIMHTGPRGDISNSFVASASIGQFAALVKSAIGGQVINTVSDADVRDYGWYTPGNDDFLQLKLRELQEWYRINLNEVLAGRNSQWEHLRHWAQEQQR